MSKRIFFIILLALLTSHVIAQDVEECAEGKITGSCTHKGEIFTEGFICQGIWFDPFYEQLTGGCPSGIYYFVDPAHNRSNDSSYGREFRPWKTIGKASETLKPGDIVFVKEGVYNFTDPGAEVEGFVAINPRNNGLGDKPIIFKAYPGHNVVLTWDRDPDQQNTVGLIGSSEREHIVLDGFRVRNGGILIWSSNHTTIKDCEVWYDDKVRTTAVNGIRVEHSRNNTIRNNIIHGINEVENLNEVCLQLINAQDNIIEHNNVFDCYVGILDKVEGERNIIRRNKIFDCPSIGVWDEGGHSRPGYPNQGNQIYQNIIYDCGEGLTSGRSFNARYYNNLLYNINKNFQVTNAASEEWNKVTGIEFYNNIVLGAEINIDDINYVSPIYMDELFNYSDYNNVYGVEYMIGYRSQGGLDEWKKKTWLDAYSLDNNPMLVNLLAHDFHLKRDSPLRDRGIDRQDVDGDGNRDEGINIGPYIKGDEVIGVIDVSHYRATPMCTEGRINYSCLCGGVQHSDGFCCQGIFFDSGYEELIGECPKGRFYYVDRKNLKASDSWSKQENSEEKPWKNAWYGAEQLEAGDTLLIKEGTYYRFTGKDTLAGIRPVKSGTLSKPIIIKAYPEHEVFILGGKSGSAPTRDTAASEFTNPAIGTSSTNYLIIDGFKIIGCATFWNTVGSSIVNCDISGGGDGKVGGCVRLDWATDSRVRNNIIHDNDGRSPLLVVYDSMECIIENNEFFNASGCGIGLKDHPEEIHVRFNLIHDCSLGGVCGAEVDNPDDANSLHIYQNIFRDNPVGVVLNNSLQYAGIINNVFYRNIIDVRILTSDIDEIEIFNNIFRDSSDYYYSIDEERACPYLKDTDYNNFHGGAGWQINSLKVAESLGEWISWLSGKGLRDNDEEEHSIEADPLFVNEAVYDFRLQGSSPSRNTGREGGDMGCYVAGDEVIGTTDYQKIIFNVTVTPVTTTTSTVTSTTETTTTSTSTSTMVSSTSTIVSLTSTTEAPAQGGDLTPYLVLFNVLLLAVAGLFYYRRISRSE